MSNVLKVLKEVVADIVKLNLPVTAAATVATVAGVILAILPGVALTPVLPVVTAVLVTVGVVAAALQKLGV